MKKQCKFLSVFLSILMMISIIPITASAETPTSGTCGANATWVFDESTNTLTISGTGAMYDYESNKRPWESYEENIQTVIIEDGVTTISICAFTDFINLTSITLPDSVTAINSSAFADCTNLTNITIPNSVTTIKSYCFSGCVSLTDIAISDNVREIGYCAFDNTGYYNDESNWDNDVLYLGKYLYEAKADIINCTIKDGTVLIADHAFAYCTCLTDITIPDGVKYICEYAFGSCRNITSFFIPSSIEAIGDEAFNCCNKLENITVDNDNQYYSSIDGVLFNKDQTVLIKYPEYNSRISYIIPNSVLTINEWAFRNCINLQNITITDNVTTIGKNAFYASEFLKNVVIGKNVTTIAISAFDGCENIEKVYYSETKSQWDSIAIDSNNDYLLDAEINYETVIEFKEEPDAYVNGTCGENLTWILNTKTGELVISGTGAMDNYMLSFLIDGVPWKDYRDIIKKVIVSDGVTTIGDYAFSDCTNLTHFSIGNTVETIGKEAISSTKITCMELPMNLTTIGEKAFENCHELAFIKIGNNVTSINKGAFASSALKVVFYAGTEEWNNISIGTSNNPLIKAKIYFNHHECKYDAVITPPTCTEQGYTTYTCACGESYVDDYINAFGHSEETVPAVAPTCVEAGFTEGVKCSVCDATLTEQQEISATGHAPANAVEENYVAPTCTENGSKDVVVYCSACNEELSRETEAIEATGHEDTDNDGYCNDCDLQICDHRCHKSDFAGFIWKILRFVNRIFGTNKYCECGVAHY